MRSNLIGAGKLGKNIAHSLVTKNLITLQSICNRSLESAKKACQEIGAGNYVAHFEQLPKADLIWICSSDDSIQLIVEQLLNYALIKKDSIVIHCSGALSSDILSPLKSQGCHIASLHPVKAFKSEPLVANAFDQVVCTIEGDEVACTWLQQTFPELGAELIKINSEGKAGYHAAASIASNYLITLAACSEELLLKAGIKKDQARTIICKLMQGTINNLQESDLIANALTGPLMRGDSNTIALHLQAIESPTTLALYKTAGIATLPLTHHLEQKTRLALEKLLNQM